MTDYSHGQARGSSQEDYGECPNPDCDRMDI